jgi:hypothetical protein
MAAFALSGVLSAVVVAGNVHARPADAAGTPQLSTLSNPNLLSDPSFEQAGLRPWSTAPGENWAIYQSNSAPVGNSYLETNSGSSSSPSVYQDVGVEPTVGQSYQSSVLLRSPSATPVIVDLVLWALGGSANEFGQTQIKVSSSTWTRYYIDIDVGDAGHSDLRLQVYLGTPGANLDLAGALLQNAGVSDAGFEQGLGSWNLNAGQNWTVYDSPSAPAGRFYLETNSGTSSSPTVYQDLSTIPVVGHSYQASVFLRSPSSTPTTVALVLWGLGGSANEVGQTQITVSSSSWTRYYTDLDVADTGHDDLRLQIYLGTAGTNLDVAGAMVEDTGIADAGFDQSGDGPWTVSSGATSSIGSGAGAVTGQTWFQLTTGSGSSSSFYQDIATNPVAGHSYTASVFLRSVSGGPISASVALSAMGGGATEMGQTQVTVGSSWQQYSTVLDVANSGHSDLRLQVNMNSSGQTLGADAASVPDVSIDPPLGPPSLVQGVGVYGPSSFQALSTAVNQGWPEIGETGGLGTTQSPYTSALLSSPDLAAAQAISDSNHRVTWLSFWTVSAPGANDTWYSGGYAAGQYVAAYLDSVSSSVKPAFVILDPEGYANAEPNYFPSDASDWTSWVQGWSDGILSVDSSLTPALYVDKYEYSSFGISSLRLPVFVAITPILNNDPSNGDGFIPGSNVDGYIAYTGGCPAQSYETTMQSWGGSYNTIQFPDSGADCGP